MMKFCSKCGSEIISTNKYCANCGLKINNSSENKIDNSVDFIKRNVNSIKNEIEESHTIKDFKTNTNIFINNTVTTVINILGIIGLITILAEIFIYIVIGNIFLYQEAYIKYYSSNSVFTNGLDKFIDFVAEILPSTILPFLFMFLAGLKKKWLMIVTIVLAVLFLILSATGNAISRHENNNSLVDSTTVNSTSLDTTKNEVIEPLTINNDNDVKTEIIFNDTFEYNSKKYEYKFICDSYTECKLTITENSKLTFSENIANSAGLITNIKFEENYLYFESEVGGGTSGAYSNYYSVIDLNEWKLYQLERYCPDGDLGDCKFENIDEIKKSDKIYRFLNRKSITAANSGLKQ